jgi:hypothetical protein
MKAEPSGRMGQWLRPFRHIHGEACLRSGISSEIFTVSLG